MPNPMKFIKAKPTSVSPISGQANRWTVRLQILPQPHSDSTTRVPFYYDGQDIVAGDWFSNAIGGVAWRVVSVTSSTSTTVTVVLEDVQNFNTLLDPTGNLDGGVPNNIDGFVFTIGSTGTPVLSPMVANTLIPQWQTDILGRFEYLNSGIDGVVALPSISAIPSSVVTTIGTNGTIITLSAIPQGATRTMTPQNFNFEWVDSNTKQAIRLAAGMNSSGQYIITVTDTQPGKASASTAITVQVDSAATALPAITMSPTSGSFPVGTTGQICTLSAVPSGATRTISPNDGRFVFNSDKTAVLVGTTALSQGVVNIVITDTPANTSITPVTALYAATVTAATSTNLPAITANTTAVSVDSSFSPSSTLFTLSAVPSNAIRTLSPDDGRFVFNANKTAILLGNATSNVGNISLTVTDSKTGVTSVATNLTVIVSSTVNPSGPSAGSQRVILTENMDMTGAPAGTVSTFGRVFAASKVLANDTLTIKDVVTGDLQLTQFEPRTFHADGSVAFATFAVENKSGADNTLVQKQLVANSANVPTGTTQVLASNTGTVSVKITPAGKPAYVVDMMSGLPSTRWRSGALVTEARVEKSIPTNVFNASGIRIVSDVAKYKDGTFYVGLSVRNDDVTKVGPADITYDIEVTINNTVVLSASNIFQTRYTHFDREFFMRGAVRDTSRRPFLRPDVVALAMSGTVPPMDPLQPVATSAKNNYVAKLSDAKWDAPMDPRGMSTYMPGTGGRADIGGVPSWVAAWLLSMDRQLFDYAYGVAEAGSSVPTQYWLPNGTNSAGATTGAWLNVQDNGLWTDGRDGGFAGLTESSIWRPELAHQPDHSSTMYAVTGRRVFGDNVAAQASWVVSGCWQGSRGQNLDYATAEGVNVIRSNQIRGAAWAMRDLHSAKLLVSTSETPYGDYYSKVIDANLTWLLSRRTTWAARSGELAGWIEDSTYGANGQTAPWMNDFFASSIGRMAINGNTKAKQVMDYTFNFEVRRFLQPDDKFYPTDGVGYLIPWGTDASTPTRFTTWKQARDELIRLDKTNGPLPTTWRNSQGYYGILGVQAMIYFSMVYPDNVEVRDALNFLIQNPPVYTSVNDVAGSLEGMWCGVWTPGSTRGSKPITILPNQTFNTTTSGGKVGVVKTTGSHPTSWTKSGGSGASYFNISSAGIPFSTGTVPAGTYTLNVGCSSSFGGAATTGVITITVS